MRLGLSTPIYFDRMILVNLPSFLSGIYMHLTNLSQVLIRNDDLLSAQFPLLINMPDDELASYIKQQAPQCQLSFYDNNFELHLAHKKTPADSHIFSAQYSTEKTHDLVIIRFPKSKAELNFTLAMLAPCTNEQTKFLIIGENKSGIKSIHKIVKPQVNYCEKIDSARHCLLVELSLINDNKPFNLDDWYHYYSIELANIKIDVAALPGVFSQSKLDTGTAVLLNQLPKDMSGDMLDFGCGAGVIASYVGKINPAVNLTLADVSALAIASSIKTMAINNLSGTTIATNSMSHITGKYHHIISNPPFHQGLKTHYLATETFLANIKKHLHSNGVLTIVANSFLQYKPIIEQSFGQTTTLCSKQGFHVYQATK